MYVSCCLLACVFDGVIFFRITDKLLPLALSILILDQLCIYYVFIGIFFSFSLNKLYLFLHLCI